MPKGKSHRESRPLLDTEEDISHHEGASALLQPHAFSVDESGRLHVPDDKDETEVRQYFVDRFQEIEQVRSRDISWVDLSDAGSVVQADAELMMNLDKHRIEANKEIISVNGLRYAEAFLRILRSINTVEAVSFVFVQLNDLLDAAPAFSDMFFRVNLGDGVGPVETLNKFLTSADNLIVRLSSQVVAKILCSEVAVANPDAHQNNVSNFIKWINTHLMQASMSAEDIKVEIALSALGALFRRSDYRLMFLRGPTYTSTLVGLLQTFISHIQLLYETINCLWLLSYSKESSVQFKQSQLLPKFAIVLRTTKKEKVVRLITYTVSNILHHSLLDAEVVNTGFKKIVDNLSLLRWSDEDITKCLATMTETLDTKLHLLSSYETYRQEVLSQRLEWSPAHQSKTFWKENVQKFELEDFAILRTVISLLASADPRTVSVACHDIGEFAMYHFRGRKVLNELGAKMRVLECLEHVHEEVRKNALICIQKMMLHNVGLIS